MTRHHPDRNQSGYPDDGGEPALREVIVGPATDILEAGPAIPDHPAQSRPAVALRRAGLPIAVAALLLTVVVSTAPHGTPARSAPDANPRQPATTTLASAPGPRLVVPHQARRGERVVVLAHRNRRLCEPAHLRFDGGAIPHRVIRDLGPINADWTALIMSIDLPRSATFGRHVIQLIGPKPGGRGPICADVREHQGPIAEAVLTIGP